MIKNRGVNSQIEHVAIIMDGNGRWAKKRMLPRIAGHRQGADVLDIIAREADKLGLKHLTVFAFSTENWKRSTDEIDSLMSLIREFLDRFINKNKKENIKIDFIGNLSKLENDIREKIDIVMNKTSVNLGMTLHIALNYGGRDDIIRATKELTKNILTGHVKVDDINEDLFSGYLDTAFVSDPELIIRTGGELRISNFLLWQSAYSEFYFTNKLWPDFKANDLVDALKQYQNRERRFGSRL